MFKTIRRISQWLRNRDSPHLNHVGYFLLHKYIVYVIGRHLGVGRWQLIIHDWTKFLPIEWFGYTNRLYGDDCSQDVWEQALLHHYNSNPHHWRYWVRVTSDGELMKVDMPDAYIKEMVADWASAGYCINGEWELREWYKDNVDQMMLSDHRYIETCINEVEDYIDKL